jgi:hypothetical protein
VQTCIVHLIRASLRYVNYRDLKKVTSALRPIYTAANADAALSELARFDADWGARYPATVRARRDAWEHVLPFLSLPEELRKAVYTTNTIEGLHRQIRKAIKTRGHFPDQQAATKLIYLAIINADAKWQRNRTWSAPRAEDPLRRPLPRLTTTTNTSPRPHTQKLGQSPSQSSCDSRIPSITASRTRSPSCVNPQATSTPSLGPSGRTERKTASKNCAARWMS